MCCYYCDCFHWWNGSVKEMNPHQILRSYCSSKRTNPSANPSADSVATSPCAKPPPMVIYPLLLHLLLIRLLSLPLFLPTNHARGYTRTSTRQSVPPHSIRESIRERIHFGVGRTPRQSSSLDAIIPPVHGHSSRPVDKTTMAPQLSQGYRILGWS